MTVISLLYDLFFMMPLSLAIMSFVHGLVEPPETKAVWIVITVLTTLFLLLLKHLSIRGKAVLGGVLLTAMLAVWIMLPSGARWETLMEHGFVFREILMAAGCFILNEVATRYPKIRIVLSVAGIAALVVFLIRGMNIEKISVVSVFAFAVFTFTDLLERHSAKEGDTNNHKHLAFVSPFILVVFILTMIIKAPDKPYDWGVFVRIGKFLKSEYILITETYFSKNGWDKETPIIGFSDRAGVGGDLSKAPRDVMQLTAYTENDSLIYLGGKRFDSFDGRDWVKNDESTVNESYLDSIETMNAVLDAKGDAPVTDYVKKAYLGVEYKDMHTMCVFAPAKTIPSKNNANERTTLGRDYLFTDRGVSKKPYEITYYRINKDAACFREMAETEHTMDAERFETARVECTIPGELTYDDYLAYHESIYRYYAKAPELSPKLREYMDELLDGAETDYEKLCRIEGMFSTFRYTIHPGDLPEEIMSEEEFLDYFIFEKQEGYCSYYSSAFVLLARACGIPAAYVQGYAVPIGKSRSVLVDVSCGHAWAEAYIDGTGWIPFEPTPGMREEVFWPTQSEIESHEYVRSETMPEIPGSEPVIPDTEQPEKKKITVKWYQIMIPAAAGILFTMMLIAVSRMVKKKRYRKLSERAKAAYLCKNCMDTLRRFRLGKRDTETLSEYAGRIKKDVSEERLTFIPVYEEILYSEREISPEERMNLEEEYRELKAFCRPHSVRDLWRIYKREYVR